ncbi:MAG: DNA-processing protein DprA [Desulfohalobiaceae bacterium]|nr:DNA-processing protein DprA [Desulfohalobiaceae bacterium]
MTERKHHSLGAEFWACLMLAHTPGLGPWGGKRLVEHYGTAQLAASYSAEWISLGIADRNVADNFRQEKWRDRALQEWELAEQGNMAVLPYSDQSYPDRLRHISDPPLYLYYLGDTDLLQAPCIAVVGPRNCSSQGIGITESISRELACRGICIVSGFARGIDRIAHQSAIGEIGGTAGVLGTGLDLIYPASNKDLWHKMRSKGLLLTEFSPGTRPETHNFPRRNRIISGLCLGVLVTEAARNSGSLITAQYALEQDREVFAVPGSPRQRTSSGCNSLIKRGAVLTRSADDVLREIRPMLEEWTPESARGQPGADDGEPAAPEIADLSDAEGELVRAMDPGEALHIDTLTRTLNWDSSHTSQTLLSLELKGVVSRQDGMHYTLLR